MKAIFQNQRLQQRRKEKHLTQEMLAELSDCSTRYLRDLETGIKRNPSGALLCQITCILEVSAEELFVIQQDDI